MSKKFDQNSVNQERIAEALGISRTTVSRCFTNHPGINPMTRAKVFEYASKIGYQHMETRVPAKRAASRELNIGVLVCTEIEEYFRSAYESPGVAIYAGICEYAQLHKIRLDLRYVDPRDKTLAGQSYQEIEPLRRRDWDGVLLLYPFPHAVVDELQQRLPLLSLVEQYSTLATNCVDADHFNGMAGLISQLVALGHTRIGFYTRNYEVEPGWSFHRFSAYVEKTVRMQRAFSFDDVVNVHPHIFPTLEESFDRVAKRIKAGVTAWMCAADHQAYDLIAALKERGFDVPADVSITGFDGIQRPADAPELATAMIPYREIGFTGARRLSDMISKRFGSPHHIFIGCQIRNGETMAPPPRARKGKAVAE